MQGYSHCPGSNPISAKVLCSLFTFFGIFFEKGPFSQMRGICFLLSETFLLLYFKLKLSDKSGFFPGFQNGAIKQILYTFGNWANFSTVRNKFRYFHPTFLCFCLPNQIFRAEIDQLIPKKNIRRLLRFW